MGNLTDITKNIEQLEENRFFDCYGSPDCPDYTTISNAIVVTHKATGLKVWRRVRDNKPEYSINQLHWFYTITEVSEYINDYPDHLCKDSFLK